MPILMQMTIDKLCESAQFEVGGYQWKLVLHPNQDRNGEEKGHISLCLAIEDTDELSHGWEVNTYIKFSVFDQIRDKYLCIQARTYFTWRINKLSVSALKDEELHYSDQFVLGGHKWFKGGGSHFGTRLLDVTVVVAFFE
ncbi:uncharacterized protein LOC121238671 [Juglans microcarpa x Juglans regia]|uniref:uncharacterized protein LOC121238671 n=1 Tax=Juglans microcarpa x Juglans regia TaxID=2249226 RepID=UPI001B7DDAFE|nr:uncharacterized protein LOC121238671 [Juglans microcarpa x Juglans regia]